ncbi:hypothetical protein Tco_0397912, partial [Tanacetum coccineum]
KSGSVKGGSGRRSYGEAMKFDGERDRREREERGERRKRWEERQREKERELNGEEREKIETPGDLTTRDRLSPKVKVFLIPVIEGQDSDGIRVSTINNKEGAAEQDVEDFIVVKKFQQVQRKSQVKGKIVSFMEDQI